MTSVVILALALGCAGSPETAPEPAPTAEPTPLAACVAFLGALEPASGGWAPDLHAACGGLYADPACSDPWLTATGAETPMDLAVTQPCVAARCGGLGDAPPALCSQELTSPLDVATWSDFQRAVLSADLALAAGDPAGVELERAIEGLAALFLSGVQEPIEVDLSQ